MRASLQPMRLEYRDYRSSPEEWAAALSIPTEAIELHLRSDVIDLHTCSFMWKRIFPNYDLRRRHAPWLPNSFAINQVDLPRAREAAMTGICWDIPTNPLRGKRRRPETTVANIQDIVDTLAEFPTEFQIARNYSDYQSAKAAGCTASFIALQGGQGLDFDTESLDLIPDDLVHRITVVHLTESRLGAPSSQPRRGKQGLSDFGVDFVKRMQEKRIMVDLAHINRQGFFDIARVTDPSIPLVVTHTGVRGERDMWRNIDDEQIRLIADRAGTIGIIYHPQFLGTSYLRCSIERIIDHAQYVIDLVGEDYVSLGSDYDGFIALPNGFRDITHQPKLVALMLQRGWSEERIQKILGLNFLRVLKEIRP